MTFQVSKCSVRDIVKLMRPKHYLKNLLLFVPIIFSRRLLEGVAFSQVLIGFGSFSLLCSAVYILNDIRDVESDRQHVVKRNRSIAAGRVSIPVALVLAGACIGLSVFLDICIVESGADSFFLLLLYFMVNLSYSMGLKHIPFLDIFLLVLGFLIRVLYGAAIIDESVSNWVLLTVISLSFYLGLGKRRNELKKSDGKALTRRVLQYYSFPFLDKFMYLCLSLAIVFYSLWSSDTSVAARYGTDKLVWTVPLVILLMMKYSADVESDSYGDPVDVIWNDKPLIGLGLFYAVIMVLLIYGSGASK